MCPDIDWKVEDDSGQHPIAQTRSNTPSRRRKIAFGLVILLGVSLGVIYSSLPGPTPTPTLTSVALQPAFIRRSTLNPTRTSRSTRQHVPAALPTVTLSPLPVAPALSPISTSISASLSCVPTADSVWRRWRSDPYPHAVRALLMDQGQLWAGTASGLYHVDTRTDQYTQTLPYETTGGISLLLPLGDGHLWAEADRGHFYYDGRQWFQVQISGLIKDFRTSMAMIDQQGDLLLQHMTGNTRTSDQYHLPGHIPPSDRPWMAISEIPNWSSSHICLWQAYTSGWISYRSTADCEAQNQAISAIGPRSSIGGRALDMDGNVWQISNESSGTIESCRTILNHVSSSRLITSTLSTGYDSCAGFAYPLAPDPIHGVWYGDRQGLVYTDGENTRRIDFAYDQCTVFWPNDLTIDATGTTWLGTADGRILKQAPADVAWASVPLPDLTPSELKQPIVAITTSPAGILWATHGYDLFNVGKKTTRIESTLPDANQPLAHLIATTDSVWGWSYWGIWQFNVSQQKWLRHDLDPKLVSLLIVDSNGAVYAGGWNGLYSYVDSLWRQVATVDVTVAASDKQGGLWLASGLQGNLWYYKAGQLTTLGRRFNPNGVWHLIVDSRDRLWGAYPDALIRYDGKNWYYIHSPVLDIDRIATDPAGRIWVTGRRNNAMLSDASIAVYDPMADKQP